MSEEQPAKNQEHSVSIEDLRQLHETVENLSQTAEEIEKQLDNINITSEAINTIVDTKEGTDILAPLADGIFVKATLHQDKTLLVNVGAGKTVEKTAQQVQEMINGHKDKLLEQHKHLEKAIEQKGQKLIDMMASYEAQQ